MKNNKAIMVSLIALIVVSIACGIVGLLESSLAQQKDDESKDYAITYIYYLDEVEVENMPINPILSTSTTASTLNPINVETKYAFDRATCTNKVTYKWDNDTWTFNTDNTADTTCKLYFVSTYYEFNITADNATIAKLESNKIERGKDAVIDVTPKEGYIYEKTTCTNNEQAEWNKDDNKLTIKSIYNTTSCNASFILAKFSVTITVSNGSGTTTLVDKDYGSKIEANIAASTGYNNPTIACTNNQVGKWNDGAFTIDKLTNETSCTVDFVAIPTTTTYGVTMNPGNHGKIARGSTYATTQSGGSVTFDFEADEGWALSTPTCDGGTAVRDGSKIIVSNVTSNVLCTASYTSTTQ